MRETKESSLTPVFQTPGRTVKHIDSTPTMSFTPVSVSRPTFSPPLLCSRRQYCYIASLIFIILVLSLVRLMSQVRVNFVKFHLESDTDLELITLPQEFAAPRGAKCLDGSLPAFYLRPSRAGLDHWIIHMLSGAWCSTLSECYERSYSHLGSSQKAPTSILLSGLISSDCKLNPDFCMWNIAVLVYCDGSSFLGNLSTPLVYQSRQVYLRGALVFDAIMEYLIRSTAFGRAENVVISGSSAGGIGALIHADRLRSKLPLSVKTLHALVDGALFVDVPDIRSQSTAANLFQSVYKLHNLQDSESVQECSKTKMASEGWKCLLPSVYQSFVFTPVFFINSVFDTWQRINFLKIPCYPDECPDENLATTIVSRDSIHLLARTINSTERNGIFLTQCPVHTMAVKDKFFTQTIRGVTLQKSLTLWLQHSRPPPIINPPLSLRDGMKTCQ